MWRAFADEVARRRRRNQNSTSAGAGADADIDAAHDAAMRAAGMCAFDRQMLLTQAVADAVMHSIAQRGAAVAVERPSRA